MNPYAFEFAYVGLPKTGSTSIQFSLFLDHPELQVLGSHPRLHPLSQFNPIIRLLIRPNFDPAIFEQRFQAKQHLLDEKKGQRRGLSNENLTGFPVDGDHALALAQRLRDVMGDIQIIMVLRHPVRLLQSAYVQSVRASRTTLSFDDYMKREDNRARLARRVAYQSLIQTYRTLFSEVLVLPFELMLDDSRAFLRHLCTFLGIAPYEGDLAHENVSLPFAIQEMMRRTNHIDQALWPQKRYIASLFWPRIYKLNLPLPKMAKVERDYYEQFPEFELLRAENYRIWEGPLASYNYFA